jgi:histidyl-tRNA synthetase
MAFSKKPVNGMKDILPQEMEIRDYVTGVIKDTYRSFGFTPIETPCMENISNLTGKDGGENEKLIFKVLKRGEKLNLEEAKEEMDVVDFGMRYDLTVPLSRFYANHANELPAPFKALQIGSVWRADRPQRGRYRQFTQCDIDILGEASNLAEIELITATTTTLGKLGFKNFEIRINDRRILSAMATYAGFPGDRQDEVFIILDKMDKIGIDGVREELVESGIPADNADKYLKLFTELSDKKDVIEGIEYLKGILGSTNESGTDADENGSAAEAANKNGIAASIYEAAARNLTEIAESVNASKAAEYDLVFDPTLVRGMSYYTGTIFEIAIPEFGGSCGGGGRYDKMVGKFAGHDVPACGFSIGFERIILLLMESGFKVPGNSDKIAILVEKNLPQTKLQAAYKEAAELRAQGKTVLFERMNKNKKFQKEKLTEQGYNDYREYYAEDLK